MRRERILFSGRVQGVGFRATTEEIARRFTIDGSVRNRDDGRVEVLAQGLLADIEALLADIDSALGDKIRDVSRETVETIEPTGDFRVLT